MHKNTWYGYMATDSLLVERRVFQDYAKRWVASVIRVQVHGQY